MALKLSQEIISTTGSSSKIVFKPLPVDDPKKRRPNISRARKYLNWKPKISLKTGLKKTLGCFK